jgi:hypothetical protein
MADSLEVTVNLVGENWDITGVLVNPVKLPSHIFIYENSGTDTLGRYVGVCNLAELRRLKPWAGVPVPVFGNRFVRADQAKITVSLDTDPNYVVTNMVSTAKALKAELAAVESTTTVYGL